MIDHPAGIVGRQSTNGVKTRKLVRGKKDINRAEVVFELFDPFGADDDACDMRLGEEPGKRDLRHRDTASLGNGAHLRNAWPSTIRIDRRKIELAAPRTFFGWCPGTKLSRKQSTGRGATRRAVPSAPQ